MNIRAAIADDVPACVAMIERQRQQLQAWEPVFWKKAAHSAVMSSAWFKHLFAEPVAASLVAEHAGEVQGFLIATHHPAPPVYDVAGPPYVIDDFCVASDELWPTVGAALLAAARAELRKQNVFGVIVVCPERYAAKSALLKATDLSLVSNWYFSRP